MEQEFDTHEARENLAKLEKAKKDLSEKERLEVLSKTTEVLKSYFADKGIQVYLIGSLIQEGKFTRRSDVDIVLKGFHGDRFELWPDLEQKIDRKVEVILYEKCGFQDHVDRYGLRIV